MQTNPAPNRPQPRDTQPPPRAMAPSPMMFPRHSTTIFPQRTNSRSVLQGYPLRFWAPLRSARLPWFFRHNPKACVPNIDPPPPWSGSGRGPASEAHSFSQSALPQFPSRVVAVCTRLCGTVLQRLPPTPGSIASSPAHPKAPYVRPNPFLQPCPFGGPVLLFSAAAAQLTLSSAELLRAW